MFITQQEVQQEALDDFQTNFKSFFFQILILSIIISSNFNNYTVTYNYSELLIFIISFLFLTSLLTYRFLSKLAKLLIGGAYWGGVGYLAMEMQESLEISRNYPFIGVVAGVVISHFMFEARTKENVGIIQMFEGILIVTKELVNKDNYLITRPDSKLVFKSTVHIVSIILPLYFSLFTHPNQLTVDEKSYICKKYIATIFGRPVNIIGSQVIKEEYGDHYIKISYRRAVDNSLWENACHIKDKTVIWASIFNGSQLGRWRFEDEGKYKVKIQKDGKKHVSLKIEDFDSITFNL